jgi:hypothetical protein
MVWQEHAIIGATSYGFTGNDAMPAPVRASEIDSTLNSIALNDPGWDRPRWTQMIKKGLVSLGEKHGYHAYASQCENPDRPEWLYDVTWIQVGQGKQQLLVADSPLVAEIEWSSKEGDIMDDFQKLLLARADTRLMVFEAKNPKIGMERTEKLIEQIRAYSHTQAGDYYVLACLDNCHSDDEPFNFTCREYVHAG